MPAPLPSHPPRLQLRHKERDYVEMAKLKARTEDMCRRLAGDISRIKNQKVSLQKGMEASQKQFAQWRQDREKVRRDTGVRLCVCVCVCVCARVNVCVCVHACVPICVTSLCDSCVYACTGNGYG